MKFLTQFGYFILIINLLTSALAQSPSQSTPQPITTETLNTISTFTTTTALTSELLEERERAILERQNVLTLYSEDLKTAKGTLPKELKNLETREITQDSLNKAELNKKEAKIEIDKTELALKGAKDYAVELTEDLKKHRAALEIAQKILPDSDQNEAQKQKIAELQNSIELEQTALKLETQNIEILKDYWETAREYSELTEKWYIALQRAYQQNQQQTLGTQAQQEELKYLEQATKLRNELSALREQESSTKRYLLEIQIQEADLRVQQSQIKLKLEPIKTELKRLQSGMAQQKIYISKDIFYNGKTLIQKNQELREQLRSKIYLLEQQLEVTVKQAETLKDKDLNSYQEAEKILNKLIEDFQRLLIETPSALALLDELENAFLKSRRTLPTDFDEWQKLVKEVSTLPKLFTRQVQTIWFNLEHNLVNTDNDSKLLTSIGFVLWFSLFFWVRNVLKRVFNTLNRQSEHSFFVSSLLIILKLLNKNALSVMLLGLFLILIFAVQPNSNDFVFSVVLIFSLSATKVQINFINLLLVNNNVVKEDYLLLYNRLRRVTILGWLLLSVMVVGHILPISLTLMNFLDSLFMLFLSLTIPTIMQTRKIILIYLMNRLKNYWWWVIRLTSLLFPLSILTVSVLGVIGYINLGWAVAKVLGWFLLVLTGWLIVRGLILDIVVFTKNFALKHSNYGLLWTQDIIPLGHKLSEVALFFGFGLIFIWVNGWYNDTTVKNTTKRFSEYNLFSVGNEIIGVFDVFVSILALATIFWLGRWIRQVTYRWVYLGIVDLGVRNSLSVFTQYAVILIGLLITLRIMGIDLTTLAVFAGALGIGIGFGLQTITNNFISGIILLIERPLRKGDYVTIGAHEGEIVDLGIRSLTIQAWNYQEIIVPNAEVISNTFTNWTYSNRTLRTTLHVNVGYDYEPERVSAILLKVLRAIPEILMDPEPSVVLWDFADSWMVFRLDYYMDISGQSGIREVRNKVWLGIWHSFKEAKIELPYPRQDNYLFPIEKLK